MDQCIFYFTQVCFQSLKWACIVWGNDLEPTRQQAITSIIDDKAELRFMAQPDSSKNSKPDSKSYHPQRSDFLFIVHQF